MATEAVDIEKLLESGDEDGIEELIAQMKNIIYSDKTLIFNTDGTQKSPATWPQNLKSIVARIDTRMTRDGPSYSVVFADQNRAAIELARIQGLYKKEPKAHDPLMERYAAVPRRELQKLLAAIDGLAAEQRAADEEVKEREARVEQARADLDEISVGAVG